MPESARFLVGWRERDLLLVLGLAVASIMLARMPVIGVAFYPFRLFGTFIHELAHGAAALLSGGSFRRFVVNPDLSGMALSAGGMPWLIASAGYVGSTLVGGMLLILAARGANPNTVLLWLGWILALSCLIFVRNLFGFVAGGLISAALLFAGYRLALAPAFWLLLFLAIQTSLDALNSLLDLLRISTSQSGVLTDAEIMARTTGIPAIVWAILWVGLALGVLFWALQIAYRQT